ncbi:Putative biotin/[propionyl-CoA-carboxylase (ATP-hydrolyzing)] ligase [Elusimicrobium minutum Pei191]|uniref:Putative biotin/[propionyl-CoA-carboxylase (ATP-hydrolyzing)] ligase n=1 Tax=Elusimicrobium minutum (strain Pei191) TaxID=445932 RepID=B2KDQ5_ELUMP|nr:acyl-CoA carboxylase subunit beta [Elusimicrobium minutum]ACC98651.1 Putative biotin/[propionyl-CoA-carboxylase (ATP-hydrolyzing)] ligase [Elusimicrobium minutum Pei191]
MMDMLGRPEKDQEQDKKRSRETSQNIVKFRKIYEDTRKGDAAKIKAQKEKGKFTARERINYLVDEDSFFEIKTLVESNCTDFGVKDKHIKGDGVITGFAKIAGREVAIFSQDFTQLGGSLGMAHAKKIAHLMDMALEAKIPVIGLLDSGGARIQEGVESLDGYGEIFYRNVKASGVIPQISVILGPCAGGAVYSPALTDFIFMVEGISYMFVTGPSVVKSATGEEVDFDTLGGSQAHSEKSGVCHFVAKSEQDCFRQVRELLEYLPQNCLEKPALTITEDTADRKTKVLESICEMDPKKAYRVQHVIWRLADNYEFFEVQQNYAKNITIGFMRMGGEVVGVVANNSAYLGGALDINASDKAARFVRFLNDFNIPILTLVDIGGYLPGVEQEHGGIIRHGAKLLYAYSEATVPKVTLVLRKAYGGAYIAMSSKYLRGDFNFALPSAEIAVMGPGGAVEILYSKEIKAAGDKAAELKEKLTKEYKDKFASPYQTASTGSIDEVIEPAQAREKIIRAFRILKTKRDARENPKKGNIPL